MPEELTLSPEDLDGLLDAPRPFFCPDPAGIKKGDSFQLWAKVGGEMQLINVRTGSAPYRKGKSAVYVDVFGYEFRAAVNVKKLLAPKAA